MWKLFENLVLHTQTTDIRLKGRVFCCAEFGFKVSIIMSTGEELQEYKIPSPVNNQLLDEVDSTPPPIKENVVRKRRLGMCYRSPL